MLLAFPFVRLASAEDPKKEEVISPRADCLAATEPGLSDDERSRLRKNIAEGEKGLAVVRDFKVPVDVAPAMRFRAMKSKRP
jgi:hypothetical protein